LEETTNETETAINAQQEMINEDIEAAINSTVQRPTGWYPAVRIGGTAALNYNKDVIGTVNGTAFTFGLFLKAGLDAVYKNFEWQNKLDIEHLQTKTPNIESFVKTIDKFDFNTLLLFRIPNMEWIGPFIRGRFQSALLPGYLVSDKDLKIIYHTYKGEPTGDTRLLKAQDTFKMTKSFDPMVVTESAGFLINPYSSAGFTTNVRLAAAGQHLFERGGFVSIDKSSSDALYEIKDLKSAHSVGVEGEVEFKGQMSGIAVWSLLGNIYYPFASTDMMGLSKVERIHTEVVAKISVALSTWASLDYALIVKKQPFMTKDWQISNSMLFNIGFDIL
jgi:hypothetical protein